MVHPDVAPSPTLRCGVGKLYFWLGVSCCAITATSVVFLVISAVTGYYGQLSLLITLIAVLGIPGIVLCLVGRQMWARADPEGLTWHTLLGRSTSVPWRAIHHVEVPPTSDRSKHVRLVLPNGGTVAVKGIGKIPNPKGPAFADASYLAAGQEIVSAHQAWLARQH